MTAIDVAWQRPSPAACKAAGVTLVMGYISRTVSKCITRKEIDAYLADGIDVGLVYEDGTSDELQGAAEGHSDGAYCRDWLDNTLHAPERITIYRAVDVETSNFLALEQHFAAFFSEIPGRIPGGYGDYDVCRHLLGTHHIARAWQTLAWSRHHVLKNAALYQNAHTQPIGGIRVDLDDIWGNYGGWRAAARLDGHDVAPVASRTPKLAPLSAYARYCDRHHLLLQYHGPKVPMDHGYAVQAIQQALGIAADGLFGPGTADAVKRFQAAHHVTADGIVGPVTWSLLIRTTAKAA